MAPGSDAVFQRRNNQIQDAIDAQNLKQALQLIEKRLKKGEDTRFLRAWKAQILFRHADETHRQRGIDETIELCNAEPPTTDLETLDILHRTLQALDGHAESRSSLWERAAKAKPQDLEVQLRWFTYAFEGDDWKSAQKAAMSLQKNFPNDRKYYFWAIFLSHLIASDAASSDADRKLFGLLAYRMICKAAADTPAEPTDLLSHPRSIHTTEELYLLYKIFYTQGRHAEAVKILDSENVGISSRILKNDMTFVLCKVESLTSAELWEDSLSYAKSLLTVSDNEEEQNSLQQYDDWEVWQLLTNATRHINTPGLAHETQQFIEKFIEFNPKSRNAHLARFDLFRTHAGDITQADLVSAAQQFLDIHKSKLYASSDIRACLGNSDKTVLSKIVEYALKCKDDSQNPNNVPMINALRLEYCFRISSDEGDVSKQQKEDFIKRCLALYFSFLSKSHSATSTMETQPSDDLCLLAVMCVLCPSEEQAGQEESRVPDTAFIRAAGILEILVRYSPHNYPSILLLTRIYLHLGAGSLALSTFSKFNVKQVQWECVAHNLFTRLATLHPHSAPPIEGVETKAFAPQSALVQALNFYRSADATALKNRRRGMEQGTYVNTEDTIELHRQLKNSISRRMWALEVRRMQRLAGGDPMTRYEELAHDCSPVSDRRTFESFLNFQPPSKRPFEERVRVGPLPQEKWLASARVTDQLFRVLKGIAIQRPLASDFELPALEELSISDSEPDQTETEKEVAKIHSELLMVATFMAGSKAITAEQVDQALGRVEEWMKSKKKELSLNDAKVSPLLARTAVYFQAGTPSAPTWRYLHAVFHLLETLKALSQLVNLASRKATKTTKLPQERVERLSALVPEVFAGIRSNTQGLKKRVTSPGMLNTLVGLIIHGDPSDKYGDEVISLLEKGIDMSRLEVFCGELVESWEEGLDGVMAVRL